MKKLLITIIGMILLVGIIIAVDQKTDTFTLDKTDKDLLNDLGIKKPLILSCIQIDDYKCKSRVYEKKGIDKEIEITTKFCEEYEIEFYDGDCLSYSYTEEQGDCLNYSYIESQGDCLNWTDENQTICFEYETIQTQDSCLEYETIQVQGNCTNYETLNRTTSECKVWKILTQTEIETEMKDTARELLIKIADIQEERSKVKSPLTDEILIDIKENTGEIAK